MLCLFRLNFESQLGVSKMIRRAYIYFIIITLIFPLMAVWAQDEQWLQYHSAREVRLVGFSPNYKNLEIITDKPAGIELPTFKSDDAIFAKWPTPMVESGYLWLALDKTYKRGMHDSVYIDSNGDGHLNDETPIKAYRHTQNNAYFGPLKVVFQIEDGPVTYHLNLQYYSSSDNRRRRLYATTGCWYEGDITVEGIKKHCVLFDYNANGTFNDKSLEADESDRIRVGKLNNRATGFVGNYIEVDDKLYKPEIARDGAYVKLTKAEDVTFGNIRLPESITEFSAGGENGLFTLEPKKGICSLPVGKYRVSNWVIERKDDKDTQWKLTGTQYGGKGYFDIIEAKEAEFNVGEPIISTLEASLRDGTHYFNQEIKGRNGERIELTRNGTRPQAPKLNIKSEDGEYDRTYSFRYG
jgi:hypothetical protein